jgi:FtsZ-binding cell division protein ZapB
MQKFTSDDLLLYLFNECEPEQYQSIHQAINESAELQMEIEMLKSGIQDFQEIELAPHAKSIDKVMQALQNPAEITIGHFRTFCDIFS